MRWLQKYSKKIHPSSPRSLAGFSIIELTIILAILSFIVVNALIVRNVGEDLGKVSDATDQLERLQEALTRHVREFGFYPCPADGRAGIDDASFGEAQNGTTTTCDTAVDNGSTWTTTGQLGIHRLDDTLSGEYAHDNLIIGVVPVKTLGLPSEDAIDPWGNRITYAMLEHMGTVDDFPASINGNITIQDSAGGNITTTAAYVLISHGPNGVGAWGFEGGTSAQRIPSPSPSVWDTNENHNHHLNTVSPVPWDKTFTQASAPPANDTGSDIIYDDIVVWSGQEHIYNQHYSTYNPDNTTANTVANLDLFTPDQIPGLVLWLDAQTTLQDRTTPRYVTLNGSTVSAWNDRTSIFNNVTPNNASQGTASNQPDWIANSLTTPASNTGIRALSFPEGGTERVLSTANETSINPDNLTVFVAANSNSSNNGGHVFISKDNFESGLTGSQDGWALGTTLASLTNFYGFFLDFPENAADSIAFNSTANSVTTRTTIVGKVSPDHFAAGLIEYYEKCTRYQDTVPGLGAVTPTPSNNNALTVGSFSATNPIGLGDAANGNELNEIVMYNAPVTLHDLQRVTIYLDKSTSTNSLCDNGGTPPLPIQAVPNCTAHAGLGVGCAANNDCCSGSCNGTTCCIPSNTYNISNIVEYGSHYNVGGNLEKCTQDSDCCDAGAICNAFGYCWMPTIVP